MLLADKVEQRTGVRPSSGSRLMFVYVKGSKPERERGELLDYALEHQLKPDCLHYLEQLRTVMSVVLTHHLDVVPWSKLVQRCERDIHQLSSSSLMQAWAQRRSAAPLEQPAAATIEDAADVVLEEADDEEEA